MVWVEELKTFCDFVDVEYKQILGSVKTRWLSLQPAITRVISMFPTLKLYYFLSSSSRLYPAISMGNGSCIISDSVVVFTMLHR
jgi:hypothetical protein